MARKTRLGNNDVKGYVRNVVGTINSTIDQRIADAANAEQRRQQEAAQRERIASRRKLPIAKLPSAAPSR